MFSLQAKDFGDEVQELAGCHFGKIWQSGPSMEIRAFVNVGGFGVGVVVLFVGRFVTGGMIGLGFGFELGLGCVVARFIGVRFISFGFIRRMLRTVARTRLRRSTGCC